MAYWILKAILTPLLRCFYRLDVTGAGNIPADGPVILASNHQSFIDSIFLPFVVRRRVTFVAKAEYFEDRRTAWFFRAVGQIPIKRGGGSASQRALVSAGEVLAAGGVLGIYPEGTRSLDGRLYRGHTGVARLAFHCGATVVPVALGGTAAVQPVGSRCPRVFRRVSIRFGAPMVWPGRAADVDDPALLRQVTDEIMTVIAALSGQERLDVYNKRPALRAQSGTPVRSVPGPAAAPPATLINLSDAADPPGPSGGDAVQGAAPVDAVAASRPVSP